MYGCVHPRYHQPRAFIATQAPIPDTTVDFWRMVWEQEVRVVVMLARLVEDGQEKCDRYWPQSETATEQAKMKYGDVVVTHVDSVG